jgi:hypothetical protein
MNKSPFILFAILLLVLVIATMAKDWIQGLEGFTSYSNTGILSDLTVESYDSSKKITKLYEDLFYDSKNGNVVILEENSNNEVSKINIISRDNTSNVVSYTKGKSSTNFKQVSEESKRKNIKSTYGGYMVNGESAQMFYSAWGDDTHIYVIDTIGGNSSASGNSTATPVLSVSYNGSNRSDYNKTFNLSIPISSSYTTPSDTKNKTYVNINGYKTAYQLVPTVFYDVSNGNLLVKISDSSYNIYERGSSEISTGTLTSMKEKTFSKFSQSPSFIADSVGNNTIIYHPLGEYTQILVLGNTINSKKEMKVVGRFIFDMNDVYNPISLDEKDDKEKDDEEKDEKDKEISDNDLLDAFSKWYMYFYGSDITEYSERSKYLLKTQVVPPVCPACPGCSGQGVCTDCGGNGGSGSRDASGSLAFAQSDGKTLVGATGNAISNTVGATGNVLSNTIGTTGNVLNKTVDTAGNVVTGVVGKTLDTAENVVGKTFDTAGNIIGTAGRALGLDRVGYAQSYGGPINTSSSANAQGYNRNTTGYSNLPNGNPNDPYSYNGKLQSKGGNFIPVTADFSQFRR